MSDDFRRVIEEAFELHEKKQRDYGRETDPWANIRVSEYYGIPAWVHASSLVDHKSNRVQTFVHSGNLVNESVRDSLLDRVVYAIASLALYDEQSSEEDIS